MPVDPPPAAATSSPRKYAGLFVLAVSFLVVLGALIVFAPTSWKS